MLNRLAVGLFGSPEAAQPTFVVQSRGQLESALALPHQSYYETFTQKLAALTRSIACNHGLVDGNKRLAITVLHSTLLLNDCVWLWSDDDAEAVVLRLAQGDDDYWWLADFIDSFSSQFETSHLVNTNDLETLEQLLHGAQGAVVYRACESGLEHIRASHTERWEGVRHALGTDLTPAELVKEWRDAISAMASGKLSEPPAVVGIVKGLIAVGLESTEFSPMVRITMDTTQTAGDPEVPE